MRISAGARHPCLRFSEKHPGRVSFACGGRAYVYRAAPACREGVIDRALLARYVEAYCRYGALNDYDLQNLEALYAYQIAVCDYYGQYDASGADNRSIYLAQARLATRLLQGMYPDMD